MSGRLERLPGGEVFLHGILSLLPASVRPVCLSVLTSPELRAAPASTAGSSHLLRAKCASRLLSWQLPASLFTFLGVFECLPGPYTDLGHPGLAGEECEAEMEPKLGLLAPERWWGAPDAGGTHRASLWHLSTVGNTEHNGGNNSVVDALVSLGPVSGEFRGPKQPPAPDKAP